IDYPQDPGCESPGDTDERDPSPPPAACKDGLDNDEDGLIDYPADKGCQSPGDNDEFNLTSAGLRVAKFTRADWGAGYCMDVRVGNATTRPVPWQVRIKIEGKVVNLWNATHVQNLSVLQASGLGWNRDVPARGEIWFGFCAQR
ncbi:MAG: cellulose binding domain-containing protein, partial [Methylococcus sp.]